MDGIRAKDVCPRCHAILDCHRKMEEAPGARATKFTICLMCAAVLVLEGGPDSFRLREAEKEEVMNLADVELQQLASRRLLVAAFGKVTHRAMKQRRERN